MNLSQPVRSKLLSEKAQLQKHYDEFQQKGLKLDMSRGKPGPDQLDLCNDIFEVFSDEKGYISEEGTDVRNYGGVDGLVEMKRIFADILEVAPEEVIVGGNSSLNMMFDVIVQGMTTGFGQGPWAAQGKLKFLCPAPGYDRHFAVTEYLGFELITIAMTPEGPDMDEVERLVENDASIKGMWCVPKYSNPEGITFSDDVVRRIAALQPAAKDFRVMWDNSYAIHDLYDQTDHLLPILEEAKKCGREDQILIFASTSKITFPGAGVAAMAASAYNRKLFRDRISIQTIGPDKVNQLRHVRYFKNIEGIRSHMRKQAEIIRPRFAVVLDELSKELTGICEWKTPNGGYFVSVNVPDGCARRTVELCKEAGVVLTPAGATFPYGKDPNDRNIRIAPTFPPVEELKTAVELFCTAVKLAVIEKL